MASGAHASVLMRLYKISLLFLIQLIFISKFHSNILVEAVKCLDCVGENCMGNFCHGDLCVLSYYAPRWGEVEWGIKL